MTRSATGPTSAAAHVAFRRPGLRRRLTAAFRGLPDFLVIGAQKCGTSSLYHNLARHPGIALASDKEVHYFDLNFDRGLAWYRAHFPLRIQPYVKRTSRLPALIGESSPYYLFHPLAPRRVAATLPQVKLIVLLRNPVDRAYSHYQHERRKGHETLAFGDALAQEPSRLAGELCKLTNDPGYHSMAHRHYSYLARGEYADQLAAWLGCFPRERMLILQSENFHHEPARTMWDVFAFLELPPLDLPKHHRSNAFPYPPLDATTRHALNRYFAPHNERLFQLLGVDFGWNA